MRQVMMSSEAQRDVGDVLMNLGAFIASGHVRDVVMTDGIGTLQSVVQELERWAEERNIGQGADPVAENEEGKRANKRLDRLPVPNVDDFIPHRGAKLTVAVVEPV